MTIASEKVRDPEFQAMPTNRPWAVAAAIVGPVLAFMTMTWLASHARGVPDHDYWYIFASIIGSLDSFPTISDFYVKSNEHIVAGTKLFYLINYYVSGGDNIGLSVIATSFAVASTFILSISIIDTEVSTYESLVLGVIVSIFVFNPLAAHNFFLGMSGVAWIGANLFVVLASVVFWISAERGRPYGYLLAVALAIAASQFYSTGIAAICVLGIQGICSRSTRRIGVAIFLLGVFYLILFWFFQRVPEHHAPRNFDPVAIMRFCFTFIGGAIAKTEQSAIVLGAVGCGLGGVVVLGNLIFPRKRELKTAFWIALMAYASVAAGFAAIGRSNMGGDAAALASRYATVPALFWIGILGSLLEVLRERPFGRRIVLGIFVVAAMLIVWNGRSRVAYLMQRSAGKDLATLALSMGVKDPEIMKYVTPVANQYYRIEEELKRFRHVPFNGRTFGCPELGSRLEAPADPTRIAGFLDAVSPTADPHWARVVGWAADAREAQPLGTSGPGGGYGCVALLDSDGVVVGLGIGGLQRPDVARYLGRSRSDYGWSGYIDTRAVARDTGSQSIYAAVSTPAGWVRLARPIELGPIESGLYR